MTTFGDKVFELGGVPVGQTSGLLTSDARLVAPAGDYEPYKHWYPRWKREKFHTTIPVAYNACAGSKNEMVHLALGDHELAETLTWSKNNTHLLGTSMTPHQPHLDIEMKGETTFSPMIDVSGRGNIFSNMTLKHGSRVSSGVGYATDLTALTVSGRYNYFENLYTYSPIYGQQDVANTPPDTWTGYLGVKVTGHNNYFKGCHFGGDGTARDQVNFNLYVSGIGNVFEECVFVINLGANTPSFVYLDNNVRDMRYCLFKRCTFIAYSVSPAAPTYTMTAAFRANAGANSLYAIIDNCNFVNVSKITNTADKVWFYVQTTGDTAATNATGIAVRSITY